MKIEPKQPPAEKLVWPTIDPISTCVRYAVALGLWILGNAGMASAVASEGGPQHVEVVRAAGPRLQLAWDGARGTLVEILDTEANHQHLDPSNGKTPTGGLWELRLRRGKELVTVAPTQAQTFRADAIPAKPGGMRLLWERFGDSSVPSLKVEVEARLDADAPVSRWTIAVRNLESLDLEEIRFPRILGVAEQERERLAVPVWMGQQAVDPRAMLAGTGKRGGRWAWSYPGPLSLQCLAFYREDGPGLYLACDDATAQQKTFAIEADAQSRVNLEVIHYPSVRSKQAGVALGYGVVLGVFRGDWFTVAERYRRWAVRQPWAHASRLQRGLVPDWVLKTGIWVWNRGRSPNVLPPAVELRDRFAMPVSVFWHWWHGCAYDTGFPEYFPPREGTEPMKTALANALAKDIRAVLYMNQRLWGMTTKSWSEEGAERYAVKGADGKIVSEVYNIFTRQPCAAMCLGTAFWRDKYAGLAEKAVRELGASGIYMDQACLSMACYDPTHGHPVGHGNFWSQGFRSLVEDIHRRTRGAGPVALAGEGCGETWLGDLDVMLSLQVSRERYAGRDGWETIPWFHAVYHPYAVLYGNYSSLAAPPYDELWPSQSAPENALALLDARFSGQFRLEQARAFVWGQQPTIANLRAEHFDKRPHEIAYAVRLARIRHRTLDYLMRGTMLRAPKIAVPDIEMDFSRLSIYAGRNGGVTSFRKRSPSAIAAAWRAPDGSVGVALASIVDREIRFPLVLDHDNYDLPSRGTIDWIDETSCRPYGRWQGPQACADVSLPPYGACVLRFQ